MIKSLRSLFAILFVFALLATGSIGLAQKKDTPGKKENPGYIINGKTPGRPGDSGFLTGPEQGDPLEIAMKYLRKNTRELGLTGADLNDVIVTDQYRDDHNGVTHIYLRQRYNGIEVANGNLTINIAPNGSVINVGHSFVSNLAAAVNRQSPGMDASQSIALAARHLDLPLNKKIQILEYPEGIAQITLYDAAGISSEPIPAKLVYQPVGPNKVRLAWNLEIQELTGDHWWSITVDTESGEVLAQDDFVDHDNWGVPSMLLFNNPLPLPRTIPAKPAAKKLNVLNALLDGSSYNVFAMPFESPSDGNRTLATNPAHSISSPFGWHDTNGVDGAEFTRTRGNNVHAYTDIDANNVADPGSDPDGGPSLTFDFPIDLTTQNPSAYRPAAVVNLFYWNNIIHDVFYGYGFNELSGNFQVNNYGRGPTSGNLGANDDVRAEAQDGSGTNNANFSTPIDGSRPRMQMFVWNSPFTSIVTVNPSSPVEGDYAAAGAAFGPTLATTGPRTADVVLALDPSDTTGPSTTDACSPLTNTAAVSGKIALLDRGSCTFVIKVKNAQNAGAIGVIVVNNVSGNPGSMGGADPTITIPSVQVSLAVGNSFKANLPLNATLRPAGSTIPNRDSDLDNGIIAHEYGHGISNRLTGGRLVSNGLGNQEQMGEGWSDWLALVLTTRSDDTATTNRGVGTYVIYEGVDGRGIRPTAYNTDMTVNPSTYDTIKTAAVPHGVGYVWSTMLWEVYWNLVNKHGYNPDVYGHWSSGGNNLAIQLVMDGMKMQPTQPGFVTGRDAIISADQALTGGANKCEIWQGFAKRGLGVSATQGSSNSVADGVQAFDLPADCVPALSLSTPADVQYSDTISLSASVSPKLFSGLPVTGSVEFFINGVSVGSSSLDSNGVATLSGIANDRASGNYNVTATFTPSGPAGVNPSSSGPVSLTVNKENAGTTYTGDLFITTAGPNINTAPVTLSANLVEEMDGNSGDITLAKASFELFKSNNSGTTPDVIVGNVSVDASGNAATVANLSEDIWTVKVKIDSTNSYWTASPVGMDLITVIVPTNDRRVTGGGWVPVATSRNGKANFGFTVSQMKNNGSLKGNSVFIFRGLDGFDYQVKSNSWQGGSLIFLGNPITNGRFNGRANVQKIDPVTGNVVESFGNYTYTVEIRDGDLMTPTNPDGYAITVLNSSGDVWFQLGGAGSPVTLGGGNVGIKSK